MKTLANFMLIFGMLSGVCFAQMEEDNFDKVPSFTIKIAPRIFSPRIAYEKLIDSNSSYQLELRAHTLWIPSGVRLEGAYRRYFNDNAPLGAYIQAKAGFGYFDYALQNLNTRGLQAGGGFLAGGQFNIGSKNALIDVFGGFQWIAPIYLQVQPVNGNNAWRNYGYNVIHYLLIATPIELGIRFGFIGTKMVPKNFTPSGDNF